MGNAAVGYAPKAKRNDNQWAEYFLAPVRNYLARQGDLARGGLDQANLGAQQMQAGDVFSGGANMVMGPLGYLGSPINALLPSADDTYNAVRNANLSPATASLAAGVLGVGGLALPGPKGTKVAKAAEEGITAYHGSPHTFDKFDMSKIGTGEGAQVYGHGLYFAENPEVADAYRQGLNKGWNVEYKGKPAPGMPLNSPKWETDGSPEAAMQTLKGYDSVDEAINDLEKGVRGMATDRRGPRDMSDPFFAAQTKKLEWLKANRADLAMKKPGASYQVRINAKSEEFLDWDRPLSEQPQLVRDALAARRSYQDHSGRDYYNAMVGKEAQDAPLHLTADKSESWAEPRVSERLKAAGIKGIRYKDAGSRSGEGGTYNYVIFDDKIIDILKRYGIPITAGVGGSAIVAGQNMPPELASQLGPEA